MASTDLNSALSDLRALRKEEYKVEVAEDSKDTIAQLNEIASQGAADNEAVLSKQKDFLDGEDDIDSELEKKDLTEDVNETLNQLDQIEQEAKAQASEDSVSDKLSKAGEDYEAKRNISLRREQGVNLMDQLTYVRRQLDALTGYLNQMKSEINTNILTENQELELWRTGQAHVHALVKVIMNTHENMGKASAKGKLSQQTYEKISQEVNMKLSIILDTIDRYWDEKQNRVNKIRNMEQERYPEGTDIDEAVDMFQASSKKNNPVKEKVDLKEAADDVDKMSEESISKEVEKEVAKEAFKSYMKSSEAKDDITRLKSLL